MSNPSDFRVGELVDYEVAARDGSSFKVVAEVVGHTRARVIVAFHHWSDGRVVRRAARTHRVSKRLPA